MVDLYSRPRLWVRLLLGVAIVSRFCPAQPVDNGWRDAEFDDVPFDQWFSGAPQTPLKWTDKVLPVILSVHQRLLARVQIQLDGAEAAKRRGEGALVFYFQFTDSKGRVYQDHTSYDLEKVEAGLKTQDLVCTESAFVLPGDYSVSVAIYDTATKEHSVKKNKLHVGALKTDPLPDAWRDLPQVEFMEPSEPPDHWFLPKERGRLHLPVVSHNPVKVDVLANLTPSQMSGRTYGVQDRNYSLLLPSLKVISQMNGAKLAMDFSLLDLSRRRVVFHQEEVQELDWGRMKGSLSNATSGSIDVKSLADRQHNGAFFVTEVGRKLAADTADGKAARVVIVLSGPMIFDTDQDLSGTELKPSPGSRVFYIRIHNVPLSRARLGTDLMGHRSPGRIPDQSGMPTNVELPNRPFVDQLEPMLKPIEPRVFDVATAEQFRKALATIMSEISNL